MVEPRNAVPTSLIDVTERGSCDEDGVYLGVEEDAS